MNTKIWFFTCLFPIPCVAAFWIFFPLDFAPESFLQTAPWIFGGRPTELPVSVEDCWRIITDPTDASLLLWFPELSNVRYPQLPDVGVDGLREANFNVWHTNPFLFLLALGPFEVKETVDIWEPYGNNRRYSFSFTAMNRPRFYSFSQGREEFRCDAVKGGDPRRSVFTYTVAVTPGIVGILFAFMVETGLREIFQTLVPARLLESATAGLLPLGDYRLPNRE